MNDMNKSEPIVSDIIYHRITRSFMSWFLKFTPATGSLLLWVGGWVR
jgi:hypothetical protein